MTAAEWLAARLDGAPPHLVESMLEALRGASADSIPERLADAAVDLYAGVVAGSGGRADAFPLLTADALLTHAFEAQAELDPEGLVEFARRWGGAGRLAELVG